MARKTRTVKMASRLGDVNGDSNIVAFWMEQRWLLCLWRLMLGCELKWSVSN